MPLDTTTRRGLLSAGMVGVFLGEMNRVNGGETGIPREGHTGNRIAVAPSGTHVDANATAGELEPGGAASVALEASGTLRNNDDTRRRVEVQHVLGDDPLETKTVELDAKEQHEFRFASVVERSVGPGPHAHGVVAGHGRHVRPLLIWWGGRPTAEPMWLRTVDDLHARVEEGNVVVGATIRNANSFHAGQRSVLDCRLDGTVVATKVVTVADRTEVSFRLPPERVEGTHQLAIREAVAEQAASFTITSR